MDLLSAVPNLALILPLPSTSSVNLGKDSHEGGGHGGVPRGQRQRGTGHSTNTAAAWRSCTSCWSEGSPGWGGRGAVLSPAAAYLGAGEGSSAVSWSASKRSSGRKAGGSLLRSTRGCPAWLQRLSGAPSLCTAGHKGLGLEGGRQ